MSSSSAPGSPVSAPRTTADQFPDRTFVILDAQDNRGGTWWTHRYPGVRSDSDLFTYGYRSSRGAGQSIAAGEEISPTSTRLLTRTTSASTSLPAPVTAASWSTRDRRWTVEVTGATPGSSCVHHRFLWMCQGYYNHAKPYRPSGKAWTASRRGRAPQRARGPRPGGQARRRDRSGATARR